MKPNAAQGFEAATGAHTPTNIVGKANAEWVATHGLAGYFGQMHHAATPAALVEQVLGLNVTVALAELLQKGIQRSMVQILSSAKCAYTLGQDLRTPGRGVMTNSAVSDSLMLPDRVMTGAELTSSLTFDSFWDAHLDCLGDGDAHNPHS